MRSIAMTTALMLAGTAAPASAQLYAAIAPEARTSSAPNFDTATYFVSALNSTDQTLQNCRPTVEPSFGNSFPISVDVTYQTVDAGNTLEGIPNTPVTLGPGATQGFVIGLEHEPLTRLVGLNFVPVIVCDGLRSQFPFDLGGEWFGSTSPLPDIVAIGVTPSADGVVRLPAAGASEVFAVAAVNIGAPGTVEVRVGPRPSPGFPDPADATRGSICETGPDGSCLESPSDVVEIEFGTDEVRTFSAFFNSAQQAGLLFQPDIQRVAVTFSAEFGAVRVGRASAAVTAPPPLVGTDTPSGLYSVEVTQLSDGGSVRDAGTTGTLALLPDDTVLITGSEWINGFGGPSTRWLIGEPVGPLNVTLLGDGPEFVISGRNLLVVNAQDQAFFEADLSMVVTPRRGVVGELNPPQSQSRNNVEPLDAPLQVRGHYAGFASVQEAQVTDLVGTWSRYPENFSRIIAASLTINTDLSFELDFTVFNTTPQQPDHECSATGTLTDFGGAGEKLGLALSTTSDEACSLPWRGQDYAGVLIPNAIGGPFTDDELIQLSFMDGSGNELSGARVFFSRAQ